MQRKAYTLVELVVATAVIAILASLVAVGLLRYRAQARLARVTTELEQMSTSLAQFAEDNNYQYPPDVNRSIPPGLEKYLAPGVWPISVWPHGVFDYDNWPRPDAGPNFGRQVYQISYRLCNLGDPAEWCRDALYFPNFQPNSSIFFCISGPCVPHRDTPWVPGYCVNCKPKEVNPPV